MVIWRRLSPHIHIAKHLIFNNKIIMILNHTTESTTTLRAHGLIGWTLDGVGLYIITK
jgi:hypothetical protein